MFVNSENNFEIIAGERRWRAAKLAKLDTIPVIVRDINDRTASIIALIENMQRVDLSSIEEAEGIKMIDEFGMTHEEASDGRKVKISGVKFTKIAPIDRFCKK